jgi:flagellar motor switch protein FliG
MTLFAYEDLAQLPPGPIFHLVERLSTLTLCRALLLAEKPARDIFSSCMPAAASEYAQVLFSREAPYTRQPEHVEAASKLMAILRQHAREQNSAFLAGTAWHAQAEKKMLAASAHDGKLEQERSTPRI